MQELRVMLSFIVLILATFFAASCGSGQGQLQSITLNPASADAQAYPNGQVPFTATGYYVDPSHTVTPQTATWSACFQGIPTTDVSVTTEGVAQCAGGATGTYSILAFDPSGKICTDVPVGPCEAQCGVVGTAQLTCP
jgi:hypothetical protein